jgi:hypothetical protein
VTIFILDESDSKSPEDTAYAEECKGVDSECVFLVFFDRFRIQVFVSGVINEGDPEFDKDRGLRCHRHASIANQRCYHDHFGILEDFKSCPRIVLLLF